jgi:hypothetical protein
LIGGGIYRSERRGRGCPEARRNGGPGRARRATLGTAALLACWGASVSAAECYGSVLASAGRSGACREEDDWEGALGAVLFFPPLPMARVGAGGAGFNRGVSQEHGYRPEANGDSDHHSDHDLSPILSARCSIKCSQEI